MSIVIGIYIIQTILGYIFWIKILGTKPTTFIEVFTYLAFSLIIIPNLLAILAIIWYRYNIYKRRKLKKYRKSLQE